MMTTGSEELWQRAWSYKDHGKSFDAIYRRTHPPGFRWVHESFGTNWRMLELQAVLGRMQLGRMVDWHAARAKNAKMILEACAELPLLRAPAPPAEIEHGWYRAYAFVRPEALASGWSRDRIISEINARNVPCYSGSCSEVYLEKAFDNTPWRPAARLPVARLLGETSLSWLVHPTLSGEDVARCVEVIREVVRSASR